MSLLEHKNFISHAGLPLTWKIECDVLTSSDWSALAMLSGSKLVFGEVIGIPHGGLYFAEYLKSYITPGSKTLLIADDVYTTGRSFREARADASQFWHPIIGIAAFARGTITEDWIKAVFQLTLGFQQP